MVVEITSSDFIDWNAKTETDKKINEIANLLKTRLGEIPFLRGVGISDKYIDNPISAIKPVLINDITATIDANVENATLQSVEILSGKAVGDYYIKVVCEI